jgi:hypothetical protein
MPTNGTGVPRARLRLCGCRAERCTGYAQQEFIMLAPGDFVTNPVPPEPNRGAVAQPGNAGHVLEPQPVAPVAKVEEAEPESFLLILLRALGAFHT